MKRLLHNLTTILATTALLLAAGCVKEDLSVTATEGEEIMVSFGLSIDNGLDTRAISDGTSVNQLIVAVYEDGKEIEALRYTKEWTPETNEIDIRLIKDREYQVLFWLQYVGGNNESAYTIGKDGVVTINYETALEDGATYLNGGFAKMEQLDAFYAVRTIKPSELSSGSVSLTRPIAQLNIADPDNANEDKEAKVSLEGIATKFNALTGKTVENPESKEDRIFKFTGSPAEDVKLTTGTASYNYIATIYLFPTTIQATYQIEGLEDKNIGYIPLKANTRSNIIGTFVPAVSTQDGSK